MVNNHYKAAIIGLDAQFENQHGNQTDIDRVERALYLGKSQDKSQGKSLEKNSTDDQAENLTINLSYSAAIERMAQANQVSVADIKVVVLAQSTIQHIIATQ